MVEYDVDECRWLNVLAKMYGEYTYIFCSCRDIHSKYSMGDTYRNGKAKGLMAKKKQITERCRKSSNRFANVVNMDDFETICDVECVDENECKYLHRLLNVIFKRFYVNDFGGSRIKNFPLDKIQLTIEFILRNTRTKSMKEIELLGLFDQHFKEDEKVGQIYVIDNKETVKVGASYNAVKRFDSLLANNEICEDAELCAVYDVKDEFGFEASAQCLLNEYKSQNPFYANGRNRRWGRT